MRIVGVKHDSKGELFAYKLEDGTFVEKLEGIKLAKEGKIDGVVVASSRQGEEYLRAKPDDESDNNLNNLKEV